MKKTDVHALVERGFSYLNGADLKRFYALYADDLKNPSLATLGLPTDMKGFQTFVGGFYTSFSEPRFTPQVVVCDDDVAMFRWVFRGRHTGEWNGIPATGRSVEVAAFTTFRMGPAGRIVEQHDLADIPTLVKQLS